MWDTELAGDPVILEIPRAAESSLGSVSSRECLDAPSGENRGRIETLTAGD